LNCRVAAVKWNDFRVFANRSTLLSLGTLKNYPLFRESSDVELSWNQPIIICFHNSAKIPTAPFTTFQWQFSTSAIAARSAGKGFC